MDLNKNCCKKVAVAFAEWQGEIEEGLNDIKKVVDFYHDTEAKHYDEHETDDHIFLTLTKLDKFIAWYWENENED